MLDYSSGYYQKLLMIYSICTQSPVRLVLTDPLYEFFNTIQHQRCDQFVARDSTRSNGSESVKIPRQ